MKKSAFLTTLTASLLLGKASTNQTVALDAWADKYLPELQAQAQELFDGTFSFGEVGALAETAVRAAQDLKGIFAGAERAEIAQQVLVMSAQAALPDAQEYWVLPLLQGEAAKALIEAAFLKVFGSPDKAPAPVVDAPELPEGGVQ